MPPTGRSTESPGCSATAVQVSPSLCSFPLKGRSEPDVPMHKALSTHCCFLSAGTAPWLCAQSSKGTACFLLSSPCSPSPALQPLLSSPYSPSPFHLLLFSSCSPAPHRQLGARCACKWRAEWFNSALRGFGHQANLFLV